MSPNEQKLNEFLNFVQEQFPVIAEDIVEYYILHGTLMLYIGLPLLILSLISTYVCVRLYKTGGYFNNWDGAVILSGIAVIVCFLVTIGGAYEWWYASNFPRLVVIDYLKGTVQ
jgi:hypothetical protein